MARTAKQGANRGSPKKKNPKKARGSRRSGAPAGATTFPIVAIGASAGGLEAFHRFFSQMPPDSGMGFVLVPHLDVHHKSAMVDLLKAYTKMPVVEIRDRAKVESNRVHVIPPNATLSIERGILRTVTPRSRGMTIDDFLQSLAQDQGENAVGIVLSGSGSDGTLGLKAIKEAGGLTFAQSAGTSPYDSMPRSAAAAGIVDFILPAEGMPARLVEYAQHRAKFHEANNVDGFRDEVRKNLVKISTLLRSKTGHDFSHYKESTCIRRIQRRMQVVQLSSVAAYVELLRKDAREVDALFRDLLIGVTQFFRDARPYDALRDQVIPQLFEGKGDDDQVRIWVPGCATGEEAYSIAILVREYMLRKDLANKVQIFATDIDDHALEIARNGLYPEAIMRDVSPERLDRFFVKQSGSYRIVKDVREMCIFSAHNLIKDAPFSKLDLISCRNLLIYFDVALQTRVLSLFHFALRQRGYLFLGPSENVTPQPKLFGKVDQRARLFKARTIEAQRFTPEFPLTSTATQPHRLGNDQRPQAASAKETMTRRAQRVVESYAPAAVVIDDHHEILHFSGRTGRYLQPTPGGASLNLFNIVDSGLRPDLRTVISQALTTGRKVVRENLRLPVNGSVQILNIVAEPLPSGEGEQKLCVVLFQEVGTAKAEPTPREGTPDSKKDEIIQNLEAELTTTRERLQTTIEELETSNEEMKSSNEEFQSVNEELQSSNEELETSKEELQSVNEELETVNAELNSKVESLDRALSDRKNLLESTEIATIFLDNNLRIKSFTPAVTDIFHLIETDVGRPITDIVTRVVYDNLQRDVSRVVRTLTRIEQEVTLPDGSASYIMRILPYRTVDNVIDGVVVTFIDISERKRNEETLARHAAIVANSPDGIIGLKPDGTITTWNAGAERLYGYTSDEAVGRPLSLVIPPDRPDELKQILERLKRATPVSPVETERITKSGRRITISYTMAPIRSGSGRLVAAAKIERDITDRVAAEKQQKVLLGELNHRVKNVLATVLSIASRTRKTTETAETFYHSFEGRIRALANAHDLLAKNVWAGAELRQILEAEFKPYRGENSAVTLSGRDVFLSSQAAVVLGMVFHELVTNAAKHGALAATHGSVDVRWRSDGAREAPALAIDWRERGGAPTAAPDREGFGLRFVERIVSYELRGTAEITFPAKGLHVEIRVPWTEITGPSPSPDGGTGTM
jgi:two-component system CheB/CheR fusion protein